MTDVKALAYELMHEAQQSLKDEGHLTPTAVVIAPSQNLIFDMAYETEEEREELYSEMLEVAQEKGARAIVTVNDVFLNESGGVQLEGAGWGTLAESANEAVMITVSGVDFETWSLVCPYLRRDDQIIFQPAQEKRNPGGELELLGDWTGNSGAA